MGNPLPVHLQQEARKATKILNDFVDPVNGLDKIVPLSVLRKAKGFAIFSVFRIGFLLSARAGSGVVIAKTEEGRWSAPAAIGIGGLGGGFNAGAEVTDFLIVLNSRSAVRSFMATGSLQLGGNLSVAIGPLGRSAEASGSVNTKGRVAAMFSYSKSKGLYGGISVEGTVLVDREDANFKAYGRQGKNAKQILSGSVEVPSWASGLIGTIERFTLANTPSKDLDGEYFNYDDTSSFDDRGLGRSNGRRGSYDAMDTADLRDLNAGRGYSNSKSGTRSTKGESTFDDDLPDRFDQIGISERDRSRPSHDEWASDDRKRRDELETRNLGSYAFGSPSSSVGYVPDRTGSAASQKKQRPTMRQRSSSIASNLSFSSLGRKKLDRSGPTPPPDWDEIPGQVASTNDWGRTQHDGMDALDRELQGGSSTNGTSSGLRSSMHHSKSYSVAGSQPMNGIGYGSSDSRRRGSSISSSSNVPAGWSQFSTNDQDDDLFGDSRGQKTASAAYDPFADLPAEPHTKWSGSGYNNGNTVSKPSTRYSGSSDRVTAPPPSKSPSSLFGRNASYRTPSPGSSAFGRRKTPTIQENEYDPQASLIESDPTYQEETYDTVTPASRESFSLSNTNASVPVIERVVALFDFEAQEEGDLGFQKGQVIAVTRKTNSRDDWWQGRVEAGMSASKIGIFPANYTESL